MPIYPYQCTECDHEFEVAKRVAQIEDIEHCEECEAVASRGISDKISFSGEKEWDTAHYNPAFGKVMGSNSEARREAKRMGMIEMGDEPVEKINKKYDADRKNKSDKMYDDLFSTSLGDVKTA